MAKELMFDVHIRTTAGRLQMIVDVLDGSAEVISVKRAEDRTVKRTKRTYVGGKRDKGITGLDLITQTLAKGPMTQASLQNLFLAKGFADSSCGAALSKLVKNKTVVHQDDGRYALKIHT